MTGLPLVDDTKVGGRLAPLGLLYDDAPIV